MDDLLREFLTETHESLDTVDNQLVRFEQDPNNARILDNIFRLVHTMKGTCGFLGLPRLEALAHAGETLMGKFRDGMPVMAEAVTLILSSIDRIKEILAGLEATEAEPEGNDQDLIVKLQAMVEQGMAAAAMKPAVEQGTGWRRRCNGNCVLGRCPWMSWSARSARPQPSRQLRPSSARRHRSRKSHVRKKRLPRRLPRATASPTSRSG